jgi:drug/metabolite transporter (DMT)-like permease
MKRHTKAYIALAFICIVWGTTYLAIRIGVKDSFPAFLFAAIRQSVAGVIIMAAGYLMDRRVDLSRSNLLHQALIGFLLITVGNGLVTWGEKYISSGAAALICSLMPICMVIVGSLLPGKEKMNATVLTGMILGLGGVALIFRDNIADLANPAYLVGMISIFIATFSWSLGSVFNKRRISLINPVFNSGIQVAFGGMFLFMTSPIIDDYSNINLFDKDVLWSLAYLIVMGSVLAYTAYMFALKELPVGIVALYAYVNPLVAVLLGYIVLNEQLTWLTGLAFATIMSGVYLVNLGYRKQKKENKATIADEAARAMETRA